MRALLSPYEKMPFSPLSVYSDGTLCLDLLQDTWSPCHNICTLLTSIQSLLTDPNCASPANPEAANAYLKDRPAYNKRVRKIAQKSVEGWWCFYGLPSLEGFLQKIYLYRIYEDFVTHFFLGLQRSVHMNKNVWPLPPWNHIGYASIPHEAHVELCFDRICPAGFHSRS